MGSCDIATSLSLRKGTHVYQSPINAVQEAVLAAGCIPALIKLAGSASDELRLNAVWALQNLVYQANSDIRKALLEALSWKHAMDLLSDMRSEVQVGSASFCAFMQRGNLLCEI